MAELSIEDVLATMDKLSHYREASIEGKTLQKWLDVLRPALLRQTWQQIVQPEPGPNVERWGLVSNLEQRWLQDMHVSVTLNTDHEGGGEVQLDYNQVPEQHRLQALIQLMAAISVRIELAVGRDSFINMLRGRADRLERGL